MSDDRFLALKQRYLLILEKIKHASISAGREVGPTLVAVSKYHTVEDMIALYQFGQRDFGENYVQELIDKAKKFQAENLLEVRFHFIGHLQTNKVRAVLPWVQVIESVDSIRLLDEIEKEAQKISKKISCFFQINIDAENTKSGFKLEELPALTAALKKTKWIEPSGLMIIPDPHGPVENAFVRLKEVSQEHSHLVGPGLSMGMSEDFERAVAHGSTHIRIGTALFGPRN